MKVSFTGPAMRHMDRGAGYGEASWNIFRTFEKAGLDVDIETKNADIEISFADPGNYTWLSPASYKIAYSAWESTDMKPSFIARMKQADEVWATSPWTKSVYDALLPNKEVMVYKHGINERWKPRKRKQRGKPFTFLHIGEPYSRKDGQLVVDTFIELFGDNPDYRLVMKCSRMNTTRVKHPTQGWSGSPSAIYDNIITINGMLSPEQMEGLYEQCDVFVYPSWGEGFGFQPLEALASGMPVISTYGWADYAKYITWPVDATWEPSPWTDVHQGYMMKPVRSHFKEQMINAVNEYEDVLSETFRNSFDIHREYDWDLVSEPAIAKVKSIINSLENERKNFNLSNLKKRA